MERNLYRRVEACFPILDGTLKKQVIQYGLKAYLTDNTDSWLLQSDGSYRKLKPTSSQKENSIQVNLLQNFSAEL